MFRTEDLAPLLTPAGTPELGFRSGLVVAWDSATGANTIEVGGSQLVDVPILNTGEAIALKAGHVVALIRFRSSYFIMGRVTLPGSEQFAAASVDFASANSGASGFAVSTVEGSKHSLELAGPAWADQAVVIANLSGAAVNQSAVSSYLRCRIRRDGIDAAGGLSGSVLAGYTGHVSAGEAFTVTRGGFDTDPITLEARFWTDAGDWGANAGNYTKLSAIAVFRSTV